MPPDSGVLLFVSFFLGATIFGAGFDGGGLGAGAATCLTGSEIKTFCASADGVKRRLKSPPCIENKIEVWLVRIESADVGLLQTTHKRKVKRCNPSAMSLPLLCLLLRTIPFLQATTSVDWGAIVKQIHY